MIEVLAKARMASTLQSINIPNQHTVPLNLTQRYMSNKFQKTNMQQQ